MTFFSLFKHKGGIWMLTERQSFILQTIIRLHADFGLPVGSKTLLNETELPYSSATVRNEMSALEEMGYIEKTHTSSGRVPSLKGYRFFIDRLMQPEKISKEVNKKIHASLKDNFNQIDDVIRHSADVLSKLTNYTAIVLGPQSNYCRVTGFRIVPLNQRQMMAVIVTDNGGVENLIFQLPEGIESNDIEAMVRIFNDQLVGFSLLDVSKKLQNEIPMMIHKYARSASGLLKLFADSVDVSAEDTMHIGGKMNFLDYADSMELSQIKSLYELIERKNELARLLSDADREIGVKIGHELNHDLFSKFSLVTGSFNIEGHGHGLVAVLGPTSMSYEKTIGLLDSFRRELAHVLLQYYLLD